MAEFDITKAKLNDLTKAFKQQSTEGIPQRVKASFDMQGALNSARLRELNFKHRFRYGFSLFASLLLVTQNIIVFRIIIWAFQTNKIQNLQLIFAALVGATLIETYFIMRIIVNFVFSSTDYNLDRR